jgi:hypothetical protein
MKHLIILLFAGLISFQINAQMKETRKLPSFNQLSVSQSIEVELVKGNEERAEITSDEVDLEDILTEVSGSKLKIHLDGWNRNWRGSIKIRLTYRELEGVSVGSSARVTAEETINATSFYADASSSGRMSLAVNCSDLEVDVSSSGRVTLRGRANSQEIDGSSSGYYDGFELESEKVRADVSSSGKVNVSVTKELTADVSSSGRVTYKGTPDRLIADQNSSGKVVRY